MMFSIIVPVYKVEKFLPQCIESVIYQSYKDFELILVDDGSPDNSGGICDEYAKQDSRIHVLHKTNGGLSDARNAGMAIAQGKFIWFLDSDDYLHQSALKSVANVIIKNQNIDMITCAHINKYNNGEEKFIPLPFESSIKPVTGTEILNQLYISSGSYWAAWKNIFKKSIIDKNSLKFIDGLIGAEDCDFFMRFVRYGKNFSLLNSPIVHYRINREGSITNIMSKSAIMGQLNVFSDNYSIYSDDEFINKNTQVFFANKFANTISLLYYLTNKKEIEEVTKYIKERSEILGNTEGLKYKVAKVCWRLFGYYEGSKILRKVKKG